MNDNDLKLDAKGNYVKRFPSERLSINWQEKNVNGVNIHCGTIMIEGEEFYCEILPCIKKDDEYCYVVLYDYDNVLFNSFANGIGKGSLTVEGAKENAQLWLDIGFYV